MSRRSKSPAPSPVIFPGVDIRIVVGTRSPARNPKIGNLAGMLSAVRHPLLLISDSDIRVGPTHLETMVRPLADERVGVVTCLYRSHAQGLAGELDALSLSTDFQPSVLVARQLEGISFAMGSGVLIRRSVLEEVGGFEAIADYLADDYFLGNLPSRAGYRVELSDYVVEHRLDTASLPELIHHQMRWNRGIRAARPWGYAGLLLTQGVAAACLLLLVAFRHPVAWGLAGATVAARLAMAWYVAVRCLKDPVAKRALWMVPLRDLVGFTLWAAAFFGTTIVWRGSRFRLGSAGNSSPRDRPTRSTRPRPKPTPRPSPRPARSPDSLRVSSSLQVTLRVPRQPLEVAGIPAVIRAARSLAENPNIARVAFQNAARGVSFPLGTRSGANPQRRAGTLAFARDRGGLERWDSGRLGAGALWRGRRGVRTLARRLGLAGETVAVYRAAEGVATRDGAARGPARPPRRSWRARLPGRRCETSAEARAAESRLFASLGKPTDGFLSRFDRRISTFLSRRLIRTPVTPNQITWASIAVGLAGALAVASRKVSVCVAGSLLVWLSAILDGCDGEVARIELLSSENGARLDLFGDHVVNFAALAAVAVHVQRMHPPGFTAAAILLGLGVLSSAWTVARLSPAGGANAGVVDLAVERLASRDFVYLADPARRDRTSGLVLLGRGGGIEPLLD